MIISMYNDNDNSNYNDNDNYNDKVLSGLDVNAGIKMP